MRRLLREWYVGAVLTALLTGVSHLAAQVPDTTLFLGLFNPRTSFNIPQQYFPVRVLGYATVVDGFGYAKPSGVVADGTDDTPAIQAAENATPAGGTLKFTAGKTYNLAKIAPSNALVVTNSHIWDMTGATIKYTGAASITTGSDGGAYGMVNVNSTPFIIIEGTLDGNSKVAFPLTIQGNQTGGVFFSFLTIKNTLEASSTWNGIAFTTSADLTGVTLSGNRAQGVSGHLYRPNAPLVDLSNTITGHANSGATLVPGGSFVVGNATGYALATAGTENTTLHITNGTAKGFPTFISTSGTLLTNNVFNDIIAYDGGFRRQELYGAVLYATNRQTFSSGGAYTPGYCENGGALDVVTHIITVSANVAVTINNPTLGCAISVDRVGEIEFVIRNTSGGALTTAVTFTGTMYKLTSTTVSPGNGQQIIVDVQWDQVTATVQEKWRGAATAF